MYVPLLIIAPDSNIIFHFITTQSSIFHFISDFFNLSKKNEFAFIISQGYPISMNSFLTSIAFKGYLFANSFIASVISYSHLFEREIFSTISKILELNL